MTSIEEDIASLLNGRPGWQRPVVECVLSCNIIDQLFIDKVAVNIVNGTVQSVGSSRSVKSQSPLEIRSYDPHYEEIQCRQ